MGMLPNPMADSDNSNQEPSSNGLTTWVIARVRHAREQRDAKFAMRWDEYTRLWRGFWNYDDKNTDSERSKLIAPALQQAIEMTSAEIEEGLFGKEAWFEIDDDVLDPQDEDVITAQSNLVEDFDLMGVPDAISSSVLLGCIYGTGIAKLNIVRQKEYTTDENGRPTTQSAIKVIVEAIRPDEFLIDPSALDVDSALFCGHETVKPRHTILEKQKKGIYRSEELVRPYTGQKYGRPDGTGETSGFQVADDACLVTEYYGLVPRDLLYDTEGTSDNDEEDMVEAIVIIANEATLLRAVPNPYTMQDRPIVAYQHDTVPGEFWGRGVAEKGYNPQKALDAELRARVDALALMTAPMMGADITRLPRNPELKVAPGKTVFTRGRPSEIYEPVAFGNPAQLGATFQWTGDLERMVQMATGAMDSQTPVGMGPRNETAGGMSMMLAGALKRTKRTMQNLERQFLNPLIRKAMWRYMQFDPLRYPQDYKFVVKSSMGIMAKEVENQQLVQMLGFVPPESPAHMIILKALFDNTASSEKKQLKQAIDAMLQPPSPEQQQMQQMLQQLQIRLQVAETTKTEMEAALARAKVELTLAQAQGEMVSAQNSGVETAVQVQNANTAAHKVAVAEAQVQTQADRNIAEIHKANMQVKVAGLQMLNDNHMQDKEHAHEKSMPKPKSSK